MRVIKGISFSKFPQQGWRKYLGKLSNGNSRTFRNDTRFYFISMLKNDWII